MTGRSRIAINGRFLTQPVTGVQRYAREMLMALEKLASERSDITFRLLTPRLSGPAPEVRHIRHETVGRFQGHAWEQLDLPRFVGDDLLFCPGNTAPLALLLRRRPVAVTVHDLSYLYFPSAYSLMFRLLYNLIIPLVLKLASAVITVSEAERVAIVKRYPGSRDRIVAIPNGALPVGRQLESHRGARDPFVLYVGSLSKRKNFPAMVKVAKNPGN